MNDQSSEEARAEFLAEIRDGLEATMAACRLDPEDEAALVGVVPGLARWFAWRREEDERIKADAVERARALLDFVQLDTASSARH